MRQRKMIAYYCAGEEVVDLTSEVMETSVVDLTSNDSVVVSLRIILSCTCLF